MKNRFSIQMKSVLIGAAVLFLLASCSGKQQQEPSASVPVTNGSVETSAVIISPSPTPVISPTPTPSAPEETPRLPDEWKDGGIFSDYYDEAYTKLRTMTLEEKVGQMLLTRCPQQDAAGFIKRFQPGGFVLFEIDFKGKTTEGVKSMLASYQGKADIPMIMATDEEGGSVVRISSNPNLSQNRFHSPQWVFSSGGLKAVRQDTLAKAALLKNLGLNLNLAPVADVSTDPTDYIYPRAFGQAAAETGDYVATVVSAMQEADMSSTLKHFPGYGNNVDTHTGIAIDDRPYSTFVKSDFIPFEKGIAAGAECVLVAHNIVNSMDKGVPACLSAAVHQILRDTLKFSGVIMTDDLSMEAIKDYTGNADPAVRAVLAGNDMLVITDSESAFHAVLDAVNAGEIPVDTIDHAVLRILSWKMARGLISGAA